MGVHVDSVWDGVPRPEQLKDILKQMRDKKSEPYKRQRAMNLLNHAIEVMRDVRGRGKIVAYLSEQIELTRNELYPRRNIDEVKTRKKVKRK